MAKYQSVNGQWPEGTNDGRDLKPTPDEAVRAVQLLWRKFVGKRLPCEVRATSGRRRGGVVKRGVLYVNPDRWGGGWHEVVHMISHRVAWKLYPLERSHDAKGRHAFIERQMIEHVVASGWLDGKLKREPGPVKPKPDRKVVARERAAAALKRWTTKRKRADTAIKKLAAKLCRYERAAAVVDQPER